MSEYRKAKKKSVHIRRQWAGVSSTTGHIYELAECGKNDPYATEYIRGDIHARALIETTAERDEALNQLDSALHSVDVLEKRVETLLAERDALRERVAKLEAALLPFAEAADECDDYGHDDFNQAPVTAEDCRAARAALQEDTPNDL